MAKKSKIVREQKLIRSVKKYASLRAELKSIIKNPDSSFDQKEAAVAKLISYLNLLVEFALVIGVLRQVGREALLEGLNYLDFHSEKWLSMVKFLV